MTARPPFCDARWFNECTHPTCTCIDRNCRFCGAVGDAGGAIPRLHSMRCPFYRQHVVIERPGVDAEVRLGPYEKAAAEWVLKGCPDTDMKRSRNKRFFRQALRNGTFENEE